jgi:hypothetical protein
MSPTLLHEGVAVDVLDLVPADLVPGGPIVVQVAVELKARVEHQPVVVGQLVPPARIEARAPQAVDQADELSAREERGVARSG